MADRYDDRYPGVEYRGGERGYGYGGGERGYGYGRDDRGFTERAGDEVRSWFGDDEAARRRRMDEERYGRDRDWGAGREWAPGRDWGHRMGLNYERRPGRDWSERGHGYGAGERGWSGERWGSEWDRPPLTERFHSEGRTGYYTTPPAGFGEMSTGMSYLGSGSYGPSTYPTPSAGFGPGPGGYGTGLHGQGYGAGVRGYIDEGRRYTGQGPRGYQRSDDRIREDVCDRLTEDPWVDASDVEVTVRGGEVTLSGAVRDRSDKRRTEDMIEGISGVREVHNNLRVNTGTEAGTRPQATTGTAPPTTPRR